LNHQLGERNRHCAAITIFALGFVNEVGDTGALGSPPVADQNLVGKQRWLKNSQIYFVRLASEQIFERLGKCFKAAMSMLGDVLPERTPSPRPSEEQGTPSQRGRQSSLELKHCLSG
jgi:hypothetical protein